MQGAFGTAWWRDIGHSSFALGSRSETAICILSHKKYERHAQHVQVAGTAAGRAGERSQVTGGEWLIKSTYLQLIVSQASNFFTVSVDLQVSRAETRFFSTSKAAQAEAGTLPHAAREAPVILHVLGHHCAIMCENSAVFLG